MATTKRVPLQSSSLHNIFNGGTLTLKKKTIDKEVCGTLKKKSIEKEKIDGIKRQRITGIPKLEDAYDAGGKNSERCTLILTQGDSAKALAMAGISVVGRNFYGVYPLSGKLMNVRDANHKLIMENTEIQNIKQILGLQHGKEYESTMGLRYGHLMIMTDQDHDGSHIKGLLINYIHSFWPSLLKIPSFMVDFITPIVKATHSKNRTVLSFYSMPEYEAWKESLGGNTNAWAIKYYKGLGTSTSKEAKEYFQNIEKHKKDFVWIDEKDGETIELAFSKNKIEARKNWLGQFEPGTHLDQREKSIKYSDFVNKELILLSMADLRRSIPSMVDGLKPDQRKVLLCSFKRNFIKEAKVAQFSGYVSEHSAHHHGEQSLDSTIIGMAQNFVGSNNINLLQPNGQFGTRHQGGKDHASTKYIYTQLSPLTRFLFPKDDDILLEYQTEDGQSIEPVWYMPIIPMVLVNGSEGIGTGWSTSVPNYNPRDIIANVKRLLNNEPMEPMDPWYRGFKGIIEKSATKEGGATYTITGVIEQVDSTTLRITELPIRRWTQDYKAFLESLMTGNDKIKEPFMKDYREHNDDATVHFEVTLTEENMNIAIQEGLEKKFKLTTTIATTNMHLIDSKGVIKKYDTPEQILEEFFHKRLDFYAKRKGVLLDNLELDLLKLDNKVRFILGVVEGEIIVSNRKRAELLLKLKQKGFTPFTKKTKGMVAGFPSAEEDNEDMSPEAVAGGVIRANDYEYLLSMPIGTLTLEKVQQLCAERDRLEVAVEELRKASPKSLWMKDLDALDEKLDVQEEKDVETGVSKAMWDKAHAAGGAAQKSAREPRKNNTVLTKANIDDANYMSDSSKPMAEGAQKRAAANKSEEVMNDNEDEVLELKECLATSNLENLSLDHTEMEAISSSGHAKQIPIEAPQPQEKRRRGRKPAAAKIEKDCLAAYNLENLSADPTEMEAESSAGQGKQIPIEAPEPQEKNKRGRKRAAKSNEKEEKKCLAAASNLENLSADHTEMEAKSSADKAKQILVEAPQLQEKKRRGRQPAAKTNEKECLAAFNLENISADHTEMEAESSAGQAKQIPIEAPEPQEKRRRVRKPAAKTNETESLAASNLENHSPDHTETEAKSSADQAKQIPIEEPQPPEKKKRVRKTAVETNAKPKAAAAGRKRGPSSQKEMASPVKKKRRSVEGSSGNMDEAEEVAVIAPRERPRRGNGKKAVYVESDSEEDNN
ncbi:DNA topoisomerase 2-like isoform X4 [Carex rostrata]